MKFIRTITITLFCLSGALCDARPPKVIKMYPENGAVDVKPGPIKIRILFDQDMRQRDYSLCGGGENFPETIGEPKWASKRAFVFSANLEASHDFSYVKSLLQFSLFFHTTAYQYKVWEVFEDPIIF